MTLAHGEEVRQAVTPSSTDLDIATDAVLKSIGAKTPQPQSSKNIVQDVIDRFAEEPRVDVSSIEGIDSEQIHRIRAFGSAIIAITELEATGHIVPYGAHRPMQHLPNGESPTVRYQTERMGSSYPRTDQFNFEVSDNYVLPRGPRAPDIDAPSVFLSHLPGAMGDKVRAVLVEAAEAYRVRLFVGTVMLLGTASEAAWEQLAQAVVCKNGDKALTKLLANPLGIRIAELQVATMAALRALKAGAVIGTSNGVLASIEDSARAYRDLRNAAVHDPASAFDKDRFTRAAVNPLLVGSVDYFERLYAVIGELT